MNKPLIMMAATFLLALATQGCSTKTMIIVPEGNKVVINGREDRTYSTGRVGTRPYGWSMSRGIPYALEKEGKTVAEGSLKSSFRVASIFWPPPAPLALAYWPMGFAWSCYDLRGPEPTPCTKADVNEERRRAKAAPGK